MLRFKDAGGGTMVEMSQHGMSRDPAGLAQVALATGLNIVMGSGYYLGMSHPADMDEKTEDQIADEIVGDILEGADGTEIRAGLIGEIGCSVPLSANERKVLRAAAAAQRRTGAPMDIHPGFSDESVLEIIAILQDAGALLDPDHDQPRGELRLHAGHPSAHPGGPAASSATTTSATLAIPTATWDG